MLRLKHSLSLLWAITLTMSCRTQDSDKDIKIPEPLPPVKLTEDPSAPLLQKVVGELTKRYPENRLEVCNVLPTDVPEPEKVKESITKIKQQTLQNGFILRGVIPSVQYFGYISGDKILLSEISDESQKTRIPSNEQGNPSLDYLMEILNKKCGVNNARP